MSATPDSQTVMTIGSYSIRPDNDCSRFRITVPADAMRELDLDGNTRLAVEPTIDTEGRVSLRYIPEAYAPPGQMTVAVNDYNSGVSRIPSATGRALGFDADDDIEWSIIEEQPHEDVSLDEVLDDPDETAEDTRLPILHGETTLTVEEVVPSSALPMSRQPIDQKVQDNMQADDRSWSQEQFRYYLSGEEMEALRWTSGEEVGVAIKRRGMRPALTFTPLSEASEEFRLTKTVNSTGSHQTDGLLYISRDIVRSLGFVGQPLMWINDDGRLVATKTGRNR